MPDPFHRRDEREDDMTVARGEKIVLLVKGHRSGEVAAPDANVSQDAPSLLAVTTVAVCVGSQICLLAKSMNKFTIS
jgi:hypothetical protein